VRCAGEEYGVEVREGHECAENTAGKRLSCVSEVFIMIDDVLRTGEESSS